VDRPGALCALPKNRVPGPAVWVIDTLWKGRGRWHGGWMLAESILSHLRNLPEKPSIAVNSRPLARMLTGRVMRFGGRGLML